MSVSHQFIGSLLLKHMKKNNFSMVDFGCGEGFLLNFLPLNRLKKYVGMDINNDSISLAKKKYLKYRNISFTNINGGTQSYFAKSVKFDAIVLVGVLQYLSDKQANRVFAQAYASLNNGGVVILSCSADHILYKIMNIYSLIFPHKFISKIKLYDLLKKNGFVVSEITEKGVLFSPFFSNILVFFFDAVDFMFFRNRGGLGPVGTFVRKMSEPLIRFEYRYINWIGYTIFAVGEKLKI